MLNKGAKINYWDAILCFRLLEDELNWRSHFLITPAVLCNIDIFINDAMIITKCVRSSVDPVDQYYLNVWPILTILINIQALNAQDFFSEQKNF